MKYKFQYKTFIDQLSEKSLNTLGDDGWELVTHTVAVIEYKLGPNDMNHYYVFKRIKHFIPTLLLF